MSHTPRRLVRVYIAALGALLLIEGAALIAVDRLGLQVGVLVSDTPHNLLHVAWGAGLLGLVLLRHDVAAAVIFGSFYSALAIAGVLVTNPFGLLLGPGENAFHFIVGPLALVLGIWALSSASSAWTSIAPSASAPGAGNSAR
jgi:hypothetical protein